MHTRRIRYLFTLIVLAGLPAAAQAVVGQNLVLQGSFDEGINGWEPQDGLRWEQQDDARPLNEQPNPGSLEMLADDYTTQCVLVNPDEYFEVSAYVKVMPTGDAAGRSGFSVQWHSNEFCTAYIDGGIVPFSNYLGATDWTQLKIVALSKPATLAALIVLGTVKESGSAESELRVRFDDVVMAPLYGDTTTTTTTTSTVTSTTDEPNAPGCADPVMPYDTTTTTDALYILRSSVGAVSCQTCYCDTDDSGSATASDALRALRLAVGQQVVKHCGAC
jgi:hypothetical protein